MGSPLGEHAQDVVDHLFFRGGFPFTTPLGCRPEHGPTHHYGHRFQGHPPFRPAGGNLLEPAHEELREFLLHSPFKQGLTRPVSGLTLAMHFSDEIEHCLDELAQETQSPFGLAGQFAGYLPLKPLANDGIQQFIFVFKVGIKSSSIDCCPLGDVLDGNGRS